MDSSLLASRWRARSGGAPTITDPTPGALASRLTGGREMQAPHLDLIDQAFVDIDAGKVDRVAIFCPPRHGKSRRAARWAALWWLARHPEKRVVIASYGAALAEEHGRWIRDTIAGTPELGLRLRAGSRSAERLDLAGTEGGLVAVGVGGSLTGRGCFPAGTPVLTNAGWLAIERIAAEPEKHVVASVNDRTGEIEWRRVLASRVLYSGDLVDVVTKSGLTIRATANHPFADGGIQPDYRAAGDLRPGDTLARVPEGPYLRALRRPEGQEVGGLPELLQGDQVGSGPNDLSELPEDLRPAAVRGNEGRAAWHGGRLLRRGLPRRPHGGALASDLHHLRRSDGAQDPEVLRGVSSREGHGSHAAGPGVQTVRQHLPADQRTNGILLQGLRRSRALRTDEGRRKQSLQGREELREAVPVYASSDLRAGRRVRRLSHGSGSAGASHKSHAMGQPRGEPDHSLQDASRQAPQVEADGVAMVLRPRCPVQPVYDLQVEGRRNFFAGGILVHNSDLMVIDDPVRDREEADSPTMRRKTWEWYTDVAMTRLHPGASLVIIQTRWHEDDLGGRILAQEPDQWRLIKLPALAEPGDQLGREVGAALWPERYDVDAHERTRAAIGSRAWTALYQQRPAPPEGAVFLRRWFQHTTTAAFGALSMTTVTVDPATTDAATSDETGIVVLGRGSGEHADDVLALADRSLRATPAGWGEAACLAAVQFGARAFVVEQNQGGQMTGFVLRTAWSELERKGRTGGRAMPAVVRVQARQGKLLRAEPVAALYEGSRIFHVAGLSELEEQMCAWVGSGDSPDRMDALVHGVSWLLRLGGRVAAHGKVKDRRLAAR